MKKIPTMNCSGDLSQCEPVMQERLLGVRKRVALIQRLRREYEGAVLNENLDRSGGLLEAVKYLLVELGYPPHIQDVKASHK
jgi:hypothetical protein